MSEFKVTAVRVADVAPHPNADALDVVRVLGYVVVARRGEYRTGDLAAYVPIESVVPDVPAWHSLAPRLPDGAAKYPVGGVPERYRTIDAKRLRGVFSQGMLAALPPGDWREGDDVAAAMGITRAEPREEPSAGGEAEAPPRGWVVPVYTDIEGLRRHPDVLRPGEEVVALEKIHGCNARYVHDGARLWAGSRTEIKSPAADVVWWRVARQEDLAAKLAAAPMTVFYGEVYGQVQDLRYGVADGARLVVFDAWDVARQRYLDYDAARGLARGLGLAWAPELYRGPWDADVVGPLAEGRSELADHVREGFVVRPVREGWDERVGRVIFKRHGEGYLLRKRR